MKLERLDEQLILYVNGELSEKDSHALASMIEDDKHVRARAEAYRQILTAEDLVGAERRQASDALESQVLKKLALLDKGLAAEGRYGIGQSAIFDWRTFSSVLGAVCMLMIVALGPLRQRAPFRAASPREEPFAEILFTTEPIAAGQPLKSSMFERRQIGRDSYVPELLSNVVDVEGRYAQANLPAGEPLHRAMVSRVLPIRVAAAFVPPDMRAVVVSVPSDSLPPNIEDWALFGNRVDVVFTPAGTEKPVLSVIIADAKVFSAESEPEGTRTLVSLLLNDVDAAKVQLAQTLGTIRIQLRGPDDRSTPRVQRE